MKIKCDGCGEIIELANGDETRCKCGARYVFGESLPKKDNPALTVMWRNGLYLLVVLLVLACASSVWAWAAKW